MIATDYSREIAPGVIVVDTGYIRPGLAACYVVRGKLGSAIVETGTTHATPRILAALDAHGISRASVEWIIVTHVHLDHAGGAGALAHELPQAKVGAHPRGARHLIDPSKLVAGTIGVYGEERTRELYGELPPIPAERVVETPDGFTIDLGKRRLRFFDAPGHAKHHAIVIDEATRGFFTGDTFGLAYRNLDRDGRSFIFPTTTPVQFDPKAWRATLDRMLAEKPQRVYLTHFGMLEGDIAGYAEALWRGIDEHVRRARAVTGGPNRHEVLVASLEEQLLEMLRAHGDTTPHDEARAFWSDDLELNAQGLEVWVDEAAKAQPRE